MRAVLLCANLACGSAWFFSKKEVVKPIADPGFQGGPPISEERSRLVEVTLGKALASEWDAAMRGHGAALLAERVAEESLSSLGSAARSAFADAGRTEWDSYVSADAANGAADGPQQAFVLLGEPEGWLGPPSVLAAARPVFEQLKALAAGQLVDALSTADAALAATLRANARYELHIASHGTAAGASRTCAIAPDASADLAPARRVALTLLVSPDSAIEVALEKDDSPPEWNGSGLSRVVATVGAAWTVASNGAWRAARHRLAASTVEGAVSVALVVAWDAATARDSSVQVSPAFAPSWTRAASSAQNASVFAVPRYAAATLADARPHRERLCDALDEGALQVRARLGGDGGGAGAGAPLRPCAYDDFDELLFAACEQQRETHVDAHGLVEPQPPLVRAEGSTCAPGLGAKMFDASGKRVTSLEQLLAVARRGRGVVGAQAAAAGSADTWDVRAAADVWLVPSGVHWVWPTVAAGHVTRASTQDQDDQNRATGEPRAVVITTLSMRPAVFRLSEFLDAAEAGGLIDRSRPRIKPSEVGLVGRAGDKTRTSSNAWDTTSPIARRLIGRAFSLLKIDADRKLEDGLQVLNYEPTQWYKPHVDYFTQQNGGGGGVDESAFSNAVPTSNNGTNRFATVFLYLNDADGGGETVFPLSTTHSSYAGGRLTHAGTEKTPGFIRDADAKWVCAPESEALRVAPKTADAVLFYSQRGDGSLDGHSLHGSCPVLRGEKWAANLWVWNRPRDRLNQAKAKAREGLTVTFTNHRQEAVELYWVDDDLEALQTLLQPGRKIAINTFPTHVFAAKLQGTPDKIGQWTMDKTISKDISV